MIEEEVKQQAEKTCIMKDKNDRACYVAGFLGGFYEGEKSRYEYEEKQTQTIIDQQTKIALLSQKVYDLQKHNYKLTKAKELLKQWLQANICDSVVLCSDTEQFLSEVEK